MKGNLPENPKKELTCKNYENDLNAWIPTNLTVLTWNKLVPQSKRPLYLLEQPWRKRTIETLMGAREDESLNERWLMKVQCDLTLRRERR